MAKWDDKEVQGQDAVYKASEGRTSTPGYIEVVARLRIDGENHHYLRIQFVDCDDQKQTLDVLPSLLHKPQKFSDQLVDRGYELPADKNVRQKLAADLSKTRSKETIRAVRSTGWVDGEAACFALPGQTLGQANTRVEYPPPGQEAGNSVFDPSGSLEDWKKAVAEPASASPRMIFAISLALAAPLLRFVRYDNTGFHLVGGSGHGKTTTLLVAQSVNGPAVRNELPSWDFTHTGLEETALAHSDTLLVLDEIETGSNHDRASKVKEAAYKLASGRSRLRSKIYDRENGTQAVSWRTFFLSSGETSLYDIAKINDLDRQKGEIVRFLDVPADLADGYGVFEYLPSEYTKPQDLSEKLEQAAAAYHGTALPTFVEYLCAHDSSLETRIQKLVKKFHRRAEVPPDGWEERFARGFALAYAAGILAIKAGVLPWSQRTLRHGVIATYHAARQALPDQDRILADGLKILKRQLKSKAILNISKTEPSEARINAADGVQHRSVKSQEKQYVVKPERFSRWFESELQGQLVKQWLLHNNLLVCPKNRSVSTLQVKLPKVQVRRRYIVIRKKPMWKRLKQLQFDP